MPYSLADRSGRRRPRWLPALLLVAASGLQAAEQWALCPVAEPLLGYQGGSEEGMPPPGVTEVFADRARTVPPDVLEFSGAVRILRDDRRLGADRARYDQAADRVLLEGNVRLETPDFELSGSRAELNLADDSGAIEAAEYRLPEQNIFGSAQNARLLEPGVTQLRQATYTTCPPERPDWLLRARRIDLNQQTNTGEARDVRLELGGLPVLYVPYLNFPLEGRKSGLLAPTYGQSERDGTDIRVPIYWNIAPHRDATFTPRYISNRGAMLMSEFRYLNPRNSGELTYDILPGDRLQDGDTRDYLRFSHRHVLTGGWRGALDYQEVSDVEYFSDLGGGLQASSQEHLERRAEVSWRGAGWSFVGRAQDFQSLVAGRAPYARVPQLLLSGGDTLGPTLGYTLRTEYSRFTSSDPVPTGERFDLYPALQAPLEGAAWFLTPRVGLRHTAYRLDNAVAEESPTRTLPISSVDGGLFFERHLQVAGTPLLQTLEPRLFYLHVPFQDQEDLPRFDTGLATFSFANMFREDRFTGPDRVGDANQVTTAVTTRFINMTNGRELGRASLGQIQYFADRRVTLNGEPETRRASDIIGTATASPVTGVDLTASLQWDPELEETRESALRADWVPGPDRQISLAYRSRRGGDEVYTDALILWPITERWRGVGRWYYDRANERTLESALGVEYETCCWAARVVALSEPRFGPEGEFDANRSIYFSLELKGLGDIGRDLREVISDGILGL